MAGAQEAEVDLGKGRKFWKLVGFWWVHSGQNAEQKCAYFV